MKIQNVMRHVFVKYDANLCADDKECLRTIHDCLDVRVKHEHDGERGYPFKNEQEQKVLQSGRSMIEMLEGAGYCWCTLCRWYCRLFKGDASNKIK